MSLEPKESCTDLPGGEKSTLSRREFLKLAGLTGVALGVGGGLSSLVSACGESTSTTAAFSSPTTTAPASTTTSVTAGPEMGREVKIGFVTPITGAIAAFGIADKFCVDLWQEAVGDGLVLGDNKKHPIKFEVRDSQSDSMRASQVAQELISNVKVDIIMACSTPDTVNPVADQAEALGCPCVTCDTPVEPYFFGRGGKPDKPFKWTYHLFWGMRQIQAVSLDLWGQYPTNKVVAALWPNNTDGNAYRDSYPAFAEAHGYKIVDGGPYQEPNEDFTAMIGTFKNKGCEIFTGLMIPPDFINFWTQATQQGFKPKIFDLAKAILFPAALEALGDIAYGLSGPMYWHPSFPFKSSLTGQTCQEIADEWEKRNNSLWQQPILHYVVAEVAIDALKRTKNLDDKEEIINNVSTTKMADSIAGPIDFTEPVNMEGNHPVQNVWVTPLYGGQWVKGTKFKFDVVIVSNAAAPMVKVQRKLEPLNP